MLSIGKLVAGQARYYLDQAAGRVDVVDSVGEGLEDYYGGGGESRGAWVGTASRELGLEHAVAAAELRRVLAGLDPFDGAPLRRASSRARVGGFDLTFSAPKSVSVVFGLGDPEMRDAVRAAHDVAVREAVGYLERSAAAVRRGHGGAIVEQASGLVAAAFRHRTSRADDPQLHTHVLVANLGRGLDGRWSALDGRRLYAHARAASFVYQAVLRAELTEQLGVEWSPVRNGIAEIVGVPRAVMRAFSRRRADIEAAMAERGTSGTRAAEAAALATRRAKDPRVRADDLVEEWRSRAAALGFGREELSRVVGRDVSRRPDAVQWERVFARLAAADGLTRRLATFSRDHVLQAICDAVPAGARVDAQSLEAAADHFLGSERTVALVSGQPEAEGETFRRRDGRVMPLALDELRYSTPAQLALEQRLIARVVASRGAEAGIADRRDVRRALAERSTMSREQRDVVERLCLGGERVAVVAGKAGTGKTYALAAAREAWQAAGHPVLGVAIARRAAAELRDGAGIQSTSIAALLGALARDASEGLPERCVLVVDEAGMVPTRQLSQLLDHVERVGGKLVLVGDHRQLPELEAGGPFRGLVNRGLAIALRDNVRQVNAWEREALEHLREGRAEAALEQYVSHGRVVVERTGEDVRDRLVRDWWDQRDPQRTVMIALRRVDVADLNARARARMREAGAVVGPELRLPGGGFAVGDWVVAKRNELRIGVNNGDRGRVMAVDPQLGSLLLECGGRRVELGRSFLLGRTERGDPTLVHGYAITGHVAQGMTVDQAFVLATHGINREWAYVAMSRGRHANRLYLAAEPEDARLEFAPQEQRTVGPVERLAASLRASGAQILAIDVGRPLESSRELADAQRELRAAAAERRRLETQRLAWLPGNQQRLADARRRETAAQAVVGRLRAERLHGSRQFVDEREVAARAAATHEQLRERATQRALERNRGIWRER